MMDELDILEFECRTMPSNYKCFVKVIDIFENHFTKETMRYVRIDMVDDGGVGTSWFETLTEGAFKRLLSQRIVEE